MVVVTRYFGGIKLGVRGLIEAYGASARKALEAAGTVRRVLSRVAVLEVPYEEQGNMRFFLKDLGADVEQAHFRYGERVVMEVPVPLSLACRAEVLFGFPPGAKAAVRLEVVRAKGAGNRKGGLNQMVMEAEEDSFSGN